MKQKKLFAISMALTTLLTSTYNTHANKPPVNPKATIPISKPTSINPTQSAAEKNSDLGPTYRDDKTPISPPNNTETHKSQDIPYKEDLSSPPNTSVEEEICPINSTQKNLDSIDDIDLFSSDSDEPDDAKESSDDDKEMDDDKDSDFQPPTLLSEEDSDDSTYAESSPNTRKESTSSKKTSTNKDSNFIDFDLLAAEVFGESDSEEPCPSVDAPQTKRARLDQSQLPAPITKKSTSKKFDTKCIQVYRGDLAPIDTSEIIDDGAGSVDNIKTILKNEETKNRVIIAVCPSTTHTSFKDSIKTLFVSKIKEFENETPIIYFGSNVHFDINSFVQNTLGISQIKADIVICGSSFAACSFHNNTIDGMCILFNPKMETESCFTQNIIHKGLFVAGDKLLTQCKRTVYPIHHRQNIFYLFGDKLMDDSYKIPLPSGLTKNLAGILTYAVQRSKEIKTPHVSEYDPDIYTYNSYDQEKLETIRKQMPGRTIIAVCSSSKLNFSDIITELLEKYSSYISSDPDKNPIIYFGQNVIFNRNIFKSQKINADLIFCGSKFVKKSFQYNIINGMCILFNPLVTSYTCFFQNKITKGLFVVGDCIARESKNKSYPISPLQNACYLFGTNLMDDMYKVSLPYSDPPTFSDTLAYVNEKSKELDTPYVSEYTSGKYIYNTYDKENLETIKKQMPDRTIIAVCSPYKLIFSDITTDLLEKYHTYISSYPDKKPIIYFGCNVSFGVDLFKNQTLNADIIICGSKFASKSIHDNTINGMCLIFKPAMQSDASFYKNTIHDGLFVVGNPTKKTSRFPIRPYSQLWYLSGKGLISPYYKTEKISSIKTFQDTLSKVLEILSQTSASPTKKAPTVAHSPTSRQAMDDESSYDSSAPSANDHCDMMDDDDSSYEPTTSDTSDIHTASDTHTDASQLDPFDQLADEIKKLLSKPNSEELMDFLSKHNVFKRNSLNKEALKAKLHDQSIDLEKLSLIVLSLQINTEVSADSNSSNPKTSVDQPKKKKARLEPSPHPKTLISKKGNTSCIQVYLSNEPIDESKIIDDGANNKENIIEIRKQIPGRTIIAVCPKAPLTYFKEIIVNDFVEKFTSFQDKNPIIYFGSNVYFSLDAFTPKALGIDEINADIIIYGASISKNAFRGNKINGMCILFEPQVGKNTCFYRNTTSKGLFVVGNNPIKHGNIRNYPITQVLNAFYLSGDKLMDNFYKTSILSKFTKDFRGVLACAIQASKEFDTSHVKEYNPTIYTYNDDDQKNLEAIKKQLPDRIILSVCPLFRLNFSNIKTDFISALSSDPNKKPIIYFGSNMYFNSNSFSAELLGVREIHADIIICGSSLATQAFHDINLDGMCIIFNPVIKSTYCFFKNTIRNGLFVVGNGPLTLEYKSKCYPIIAPPQNTCYLNGTNLMEPSYKITLPTHYTIDFPSILEYIVQRSMEFQIPGITVYEPEKHTYNDYDLSNLEAIRKKMPGRPIIAICSPCKLNFSNIKTDFIEKYNILLSSDSDKKLIIYFGINVCFNSDSFTSQSLGIKEINADLIICGARISRKAFHGNTIDGMCILFNPDINTISCFLKNTIHNGLFVVGNGPSIKNKHTSYPIVPIQNAFYLAGTNLMDTFYRTPLLSPYTVEFPSILDYAIQTSKYFETPHIAEYDPEKYLYNDYDQKNLEIIRKQMRNSTIIAVCSPCKLDFSDIKTEFVEKYNKHLSSNPDKKLVIYFGRNVYFSRNSFTGSLGKTEINADIIICESKFVQKSFQSNTINGMCIIFNPVMNLDTCFSQNTIKKGLFVAGDGPSRDVKTQPYPIYQYKVAYYLSGKNLMDDKFRKFTVENDFAKILRYAILASEI